MQWMDAWRCQCAGLRIGNLPAHGSHDATAAPAPDQYRSGAASCILRALVTPVLAEFAIFEGNREGVQDRPHGDSGR